MFRRQQVQGGVGDLQVLLTEGERQDHGMHWRPAVTVTTFTVRRRLYDFGVVNRDKQTGFRHPSRSTTTIGPREDCVPRPIGTM